MSRAHLTILLALAIGLQALLGGYRDATSLCLGGGHRHGPAAATTHQSGCAHAPGWPRPAQKDQHNEGCDCFDLQLAAAELVAPARAEAGQLLAGHQGHARVGTVPGAGGPVAGRSPHPPWHDPGGASRKADLATVRLLI